MQLLLFFLPSLVFGYWCPPCKYIESYPFEGTYFLQEGADHVSLCGNPEECVYIKEGNGDRFCMAEGGNFTYDDCYLTTQPPSVDGNWGEWTHWSVCDSTTGTQTRDRQCNNPAPQNGGLQCQGSSSETTSCFYGRARLIGGDGNSYGNVYTRNSAGLYGPVCDDSWDHNDASVVCAILGFRRSTAVAKRYSLYGSVPNDFSLDDVGCEGSETSLDNCPHNLEENCGSSEGAGVRCPGTTVSLVGGDGRTSGNVYVINSNGFYGPVCDDHWTQAEAGVVCASLGFSRTSAQAVKFSTFGSVPSDHAMDDVYCDEGGNHLEDCTYILSENCGDGEGAGVYCFPEVTSVTLVGGDGSSSGNVIIENSLGQVGPVCDDSWDNVDAGVVCASLGFSRHNAQAVHRSFFGPVSSFAMDDLHCTGSETKLEDCTHITSHNCGSHEGAGVQCYPKVYESSVTLVGGDGVSSGNVFMRNSNGFFGPVCDDGWGIEDAQVVCASLGFDRAQSEATTNSFFGNVPSDFSLDDVACTGSETGIEECTSITNENCGPTEGAGVRCFGDGWGRSSIDIEHDMKNENTNGTAHAMGNFRSFKAQEDKSNGENN